MYSRSKTIADLYDNALSAPHDPDVRSAWRVFNDETHAQYRALVSQGYHMELTDNPLTYVDTCALRLAVRQKRLLVYTGGKPSDLMTIQQNFEFRFVHDILGHAIPNYDPGHSGEERAYLAHKAYYSQEAIKALATETRGQNCALHFSDKLGNDPATIEIPRFDVPLNFPIQKAFILPAEYR